MTKEQQIEEMARVWCGMDYKPSCRVCGEENCYEIGKSKMIYDAGYRKAPKYMIHPDSKIEMIPSIETVRADTVREMQERIAQYIGTYTDKSFVYVSAMFKLIDRVAKEMLEGNDEVQK